MGLIMKRMALCLATNIVIVLVLGITLRLLGFEGISGGLGMSIKKLFMSHPPRDERIARLRSSY